MRRLELDEMVDELNFRIDTMESQLRAARDFLVVNYLNDQLSKLRAELKALEARSVEVDDDD